MPRFHDQPRIIGEIGGNSIVLLDVVENGDVCRKWDYQGNTAALLSDSHAQLRLLLDLDFVPNSCRNADAKARTIAWLGVVRDLDCQARFILAGGNGGGLSLDAF